MKPRDPSVRKAGKGRYLDRRLRGLLSVRSVLVLALAPTGIGGIGLRLAARGLVALIVLTGVGILSRRSTTVDTSGRQLPVPRLPAEQTPDC